VRNHALVAFPSTRITCLSVNSVHDYSVSSSEHVDYDVTNKREHQGTVETTSKTIRPKMRAGDDAAFPALLSIMTFEHAPVGIEDITVDVRAVVNFEEPALAAVGAGDAWVFEAGRASTVGTEPPAGSRTS